MPAETKQLAKAGTDDLEAYNAYLQGLYHYNTWSKEGLKKSVDYFEQAVARDPGFAKAHAAMAFSYDLLAEYGYLLPGDAFPRMKDLARRALKIDATTAEAYTALALAAGYYDRDWIRADEAYRRALELNPNSVVTHDWYGVVFLGPMGRHDEAVAHSKRAKEFDPLTAYIRVDLGWTYNHARRWDDAIAECKQIPDIDLSFISPTGASASLTGRRACLRTPLPHTSAGSSWSPTIWVSKPTWRSSMPIYAKSPGAEHAGGVQRESAAGIRAAVRISYGPYGGRRPGPHLRMAGQDV
jgi:tetratricopeptide (TPR) repeat protein